MKHPLDIFIGKRTRQRRWLLGVTQAQLAKQVGIGVQQLQLYETGMNRISASQLWNVADALEVPISYFFEGLGDRAKDSRVQAGPTDLLSDNDALAVVMSYCRSPDDQHRRQFDLALSLDGAA